MKRTNSQIAADLSASIASQFSHFSTTPSPSGCIILSDICTDGELIEAVRLLAAVALINTCVTSYAKGDLWDLMQKRGINGTNVMRTIYGADKAKAAAKSWARCCRVSRAIKPCDRDLTKSFDSYLKAIEGQCPSKDYIGIKHEVLDGVQFDLTGDPIMCSEVGTGERPVRITRRMWSALAHLAQKYAPLGGIARSEYDPAGDIDRFAD